MKRLITISIFLITLLSAPAFALTSYEDESWIGAYMFKNNLSSIEKYQPFILVRDGNYLINQPGNAVRTILADYILAQNFSLSKNLKEISESTSDITEITNVIDNLCAQCSSFNEYEKYIYEIKALLLLKAEVQAKKQYLQIYLGSEYYSKFYYDFYHLRLVQKEMTVPNNQHWANSKVAFKRPETKKIIEEVQVAYLKGAYSTKVQVHDGVLDDSQKATERLNTMIPIYPSTLKNTTSPLVSEQKIPMDNNLRIIYLNRFGSKIHFEWLNHVDLLTFTFDRLFLEKIDSYFSLFDNSLIDLINNHYKSKFGSVDTTMYTKNNLTSLLKSKIGN